MKIWAVIFLGSAASLAVLWFTSLPLGIPGEWIWQRSAAEPDTVWNLCGGAVATGLVTMFISLGRRRFEIRAAASSTPVERIAWLCGLVVVGFVWMWIVQEISPVHSRLGKSPFVLYYSSSSGYFTRARYEQPDAFALMSGYEGLMREGDVLHTGTHPPGLFLAFHGLIAVCQTSPWLSGMLEATQPASFREACDIIAKNAARASASKPFLGPDRNVLWLATLLIMLAASLTVAPLYWLLRRSCSAANAWTFAALWPATPAVLVFIPKSDAAFPLIGVTLLWLWLTAWDRRSLVVAFLAGLVTWCGLMCSLAFLPIVLAAAIATLTSIFSVRGAALEQSAPNANTNGCHSNLGMRRWLCIACAGAGLAIPTLLVWIFLHVNMLNVWLLNYKNHAGFYQQYVRNYWNWLMINPLETCFAAGWPLASLALLGCWEVIRAFRSRNAVLRPQVVRDAISIMSVWGLLWITGKNSGEAARLWILFLPWLIWLASIRFESFLHAGFDLERRQRHSNALLVTQFVVCLLTVMRVNGFPIEAN